MELKTWIVNIRQNSDSSETGEGFVIYKWGKVFNNGSSRICG